MFVTVWMAILDIETGKLTCTNAGHEYPFIRTKDKGFRLYEDNSGQMVGVNPNAVFQDYELTLEKGDAIFVYTDGIPEAVDASDAMYGMDRLEEILNRIEDQSPEGILEGVSKDVDDFVHNTPQFDDLTMLCLEYNN